MRQIKVIGFLLLLNFFTSCKSKIETQQYKKPDSTLLLDSNNVMDILHEVYRIGYIHGSNNAVQGFNNDVIVDKDYVLTHFFKDSTLFFKRLVITNKN